MKCFKHELENTYSPSTLEAKLFFSCFAFWLAILHFHLEFDDTCQTSPSPGLILNKTLDLISLRLLYPFLTVLQTVLYYAQVNISFFFTIAQACCAVLQSWVSRKFMTGWYAFLKNWTKLLVKLMDYLLYMHDIFFFFLLPSYVCFHYIFKIMLSIRHFLLTS